MDKIKGSANQICVLCLSQPACFGQMHPSTIHTDKRTIAFSYPCDVETTNRKGDCTPFWSAQSLIGKNPACAQIGMITSFCGSSTCCADTEWQRDPRMHGESRCAGSCGQPGQRQHCRSSHNRSRCHSSNRVRRSRCSW